MAVDTFIVDANAFITPSNSYYDFNLFPSYWDWLIDMGQNGNFIVIDKVIEELTREKEERHKDKLQKWIENEFNINKVSTDDLEIIDNYRKVLNHISTSGRYRETALREWADIEVADPWLIATAMKFNVPIVSFEKIQNYQPKNPLKRAKIPNVCSDMGIECINLFEMLKRLNFSL